jgi:hypothetical protein
MHQLFASFVRELPLSAEDQLVFARIVPVQAARFVELASLVSSNPADLETAAILLNYPLKPETWSSLGVEISIEDGEQIGRALHRIGRFVEAQPWHQRAVLEWEKGDPETEQLLRRYAERPSEFGPDDGETHALGSEVAKAMKIEGEGKVDRITHELVNQVLVERFRALDNDTRKLVLAKAGLLLSQPQ